MRVQFDYTQADMADASMRVLDRSQSMRRWRWQGLITAAIIAWLLVFFFFRTWTIKGVLLASAASVISALLVASQQKRTTEKRMRKYLREKFGDRNDFVCALELNPAEIALTHADGNMTLDWSTVEEIVATADSVDIFTRGGGVIVRDRAFHSADEKREFVDLARRYLTQARETEK